MLNFQSFLDLRAFEKRLTEVVHHLQPTMWKNRSKYREILNELEDLSSFFSLVLLVILILLTIFGAWSWLIDPQTAKVIKEKIIFNLNENNFKLLFRYRFTTLF